MELGLHKYISKFIILKYHNLSLASNKYNNIQTKMGCTEACMHPIEREEKSIKKEQSEINSQIQTAIKLAERREREISDIKIQTTNIKRRIYDFQRQVTAKQHDIKILQEDIKILQKQQQHERKNRNKRQSIVNQMVQRASLLSKQIQDKRQQHQHAISQLQEQIKSIKVQLKQSNEQLDKYKSAGIQMSRINSNDTKTLKSESLAKDKQLLWLENEVWQMQLQYQRLTGDNQPLSRTKQAFKQRILAKVDAQILNIN